MAAANTRQEEELLKKQEKAWQRKHQREAKLEETKMATINRILQKQSSRSKKMKSSFTNGVKSTTGNLTTITQFSHYLILYSLN